MGTVSNCIEIQGNERWRLEGDPGLSPEDRRCLEVKYRRRSLQRRGFGKSTIKPLRAL